MSQISAISQSVPESPSDPVKPSLAAYARQPTVKLEQHIFSSGEWKRAKFLAHPKLELLLFVCKDDYRAFDLRPPSTPKSVRVDAKLDTCTQPCLWSLKSA